MKIGISLVLFFEPRNRLYRFIEEIENIFKNHELLICIHLNSHHDYKFPAGVIVNAFQENLGYGQGHNLNYKILSNENCKKILVSNTDVKFSSNILELVSMNSVLSAPLVLNIDGSDQRVIRAFPTLMTKIRSFISKYPYSYAPDVDGEYIVPSISGCFFVVCVDSYDALGYNWLFDPRFFMYEEDTDLCRRLWIVKGVKLSTKARVYHSYEKGSSKKVKLFFYHLRSITSYFGKWGIHDKAFDDSIEFMSHLNE